MDRLEAVLRQKFERRVRMLKSQEAYSDLGTESRDFEELIAALDSNIQQLIAALQKLHLAALNRKLSEDSPELVEMAELLARIHADTEAEELFSGSVAKENSAKSKIEKTTMSVNGVRDA